MADIERISVQEAHAKTTANQALLVCAYEDEAKCRMLNLEGSGEALLQRKAFDTLSAGEQNEIIEFLKSLQVLPPNARSLVLDEEGHPRHWPPVPRQIVVRPQSE